MNFDKCSKEINTQVYKVININVTTIMKVKITYNYNYFGNFKEKTI